MSSWCKRACKSCLYSCCIECLWQVNTKKWSKIMQMVGRWRPSSTLRHIVRLHLLSMRREGIDLQGIVGLQAIWNRARQAKLQNHISLEPLRSFLISKFQIKVPLDAGEKANNQSEQWNMTCDFSNQDWWCFSVSHCVHPIPKCTNGCEWHRNVRHLRVQVKWACGFIWFSG